jgi:hypothetical protein
VSLKDRIDSILPDYPVIPTLIVPADEWKGWSDEQQYMWLAHHAGSWQTKFFVSWAMSSIDKLWVKYEEFYANQQDGWRKIFDFYGMPHPPQDALDFCAGQKNNNFNVGVTGRGHGLPLEVKMVLDANVESWGTKYADMMFENLY